MECGSRDFSCYVIGLLAAHGVELMSWLPIIEGRIRENLQALIGLAGFSFGVWKWWYFREKVLHKRLKEYLDLQDERLTTARSYIIEALHRPGTARSFAEPLFTIRSLRRVLRRKNWNSLLQIRKLETSADRLLDKSIGQLNTRLEAASKQLQLLHQQQASAFVIKGAIASARAHAAKIERQALNFDYRSLDAFRAALQVPGQGSDIELLEFEAHQLRKLGHLDEADECYCKIEIRLAEAPSGRERDLALARTRKWRAIIAQAKVILDVMAKRRTGAGCANADGWLRLNDDSSLKLRARHSPFHDWEGLEQGDLHYVTAYVCANLSFSNLENQHLGLAETEYRRVLDRRDASSWWRGGSNRTLTDAAAAGTKRVEKARVDKPKDERYEQEWLLPPLKPVQRPTAHITDASRDEAVGKAAKKDQIDDSRKP